MAPGSGPGGIVFSKRLLTDFHSDKSVLHVQVTLLARIAGTQANAWPNCVTSTLKNIEDTTEFLPYQGMWPGLCGDRQ